MGETERREGRNERVKSKEQADKEGERGTMLVHVAIIPWPPTFLRLLFTLSVPELSSTFGQFAVHPPSLPVPLFPPHLSFSHARVLTKSKLLAETSSR